MRHQPLDSRRRAAAGPLALPAFAGVVALALTACANSRALEETDGAVAHPPDAAPVDAPIDGAAPDAETDARAPRTELGPCDEPALWASEAIPSRTIEILNRCGATNRRLQEVALSLATEACFRVAEASLESGWEEGAVWREVAGPADIVVTTLRVNVNAGPFELRARYVVDGRLYETPLVHDSAPRPALASAVEGFVGIGRPTGRAGAVHVVTDTEVRGPEGSAWPLSGTAVDAAAWLPWTVVLVETEEGLVLEVLPESLDEAFRRIPVEVSASSRLAPAGTPALIDRDMDEVVLFDSRRLDELGRMRLPAHAGDVIVNAREGSAYVRLGEQVWRSALGEAPRQLFVVPDLRALVPVPVPGPPGVVAITDGAFDAIEALSASAPAPRVRLLAPLEGEVLASVGGWVTSGGFAWPPPFSPENVVRGPVLYDARTVHGGPVVDFDAAAGAYAVEAADGRVDIYPWSPGRCFFD